MSRFVLDKLHAEKIITARDLNGSVEIAVQYPADASYRARMSPMQARTLSEVLQTLASVAEQRANE